MRLKSKLIFKLYQTITAILAPLALIFLVYKKRRDPPYGMRAWELLGFRLPKLGRCVWFHTVSVGEAAAAAPLIKTFVLQHPDLKVLVTTTTTTGAARLSSIHGIHHVFAPLDSPCAWRRFFKVIHPSCLFIMESELWPQMLHAARQHGTKIAIFNARMPQRSFLKYQKHAALTQDLLSSKLDLVLCQNPDDAKRFLKLGVAADKLCIVNSLKYDLKLNEDRFKQGLQLKSAHFTLGAISIHAAECAAVIEAYLKTLSLRPDLRLILVPRHQDAGEIALELLKQHGIQAQRRSKSDEKGLQSAQIIIGDTFGEIEFYLGLCDAVIMGGSFTPVGGHNPLEPAYFNLPIITGPYWFNFDEQFKLLFNLGSALEATNAAALPAMIADLCAKPHQLQEKCLQARTVLAAKRGATALTLQALDRLLP